MTIMVLDCSVCRFVLCIYGIICVFICILDDDCIFICDKIVDSCFGAAEYVRI